MSDQSSELTSVQSLDYRAVNIIFDPLKVSGLPVPVLTFRGCKATRAGTFAIPNNAITPVQWNSELFDTDAFHSGGGANPERITIPSGVGLPALGVYAVVSMLYFAQDGTGTRAAGFRVNGVGGVAVEVATNPNPRGTGLAICDIFQLAPNDFVDVIAFQTSGGNLNIVATTGQTPSFSLYLIGQ